MGASVSGRLSELLDRLDTESVGESVHIDHARKLITDAYQAGVESTVPQPEGTYKDITWGAGWVSRGDRRVVLSRKQHDVFCVLAAHFETIVATTDIRQRIWQGDFVSLNTIEVHVSSLRRVLAPLGIRIPTDRGYGGYRLTLTGSDS